MTTSTLNRQAVPVHTEPSIMGLMFVGLPTQAKAHRPLEEAQQRNSPAAPVELPHTAQAAPGSALR